MFKIFCVVCFTQMGTLQNTICFPSSIPIEFDTIEQCNLEKDRIANYMHKDLVERNASVYLQCAENIKGQINI